jgi:acyl-CoA synthetase (AMP-forming)/AMP-acid ligase II
MLDEAIAMEAELDLSPGTRLATMVPVHHSFGFGDCVLSGMLAGVEVHSIPRMLLPSACLAELVDKHIDAVAMVPPQLRLLADASKSALALAPSVLSAGAPLDARTAQLATERIGCPIGQVYGTSETGVIGVAQPRLGGTLCVGAPSHHVDVRLDALPPEWTSSGCAAGVPEGVVSVRTKALFEGYVSRSGVDTSAIGHGWFVTGDRARWVGDQLQLLGRLSSAINVAGVKISAEEIESALLEFPGVNLALVFGVDDPLTHKRIKALVTPANIDLAALRRFCEERLSPSKRPYYYEAVASIPATASGKVLRRSNPQHSTPSHAG